MKLRIHIVSLFISLAFCAPGLVAAQEKSYASPQARLGKVVFPNSCSAAVQEKFQSGVAMLHSFWYSEAEKTFREVLAPACTFLASRWHLRSGVSARGSSCARARPSLRPISCCKRAPSSPTGSAASCA